MMLNDKIRFLLLIKVTKCMYRDEKLALFVRLRCVCVSGFVRFSGLSSFVNASLCVVRKVLIYVCVCLNCGLNLVEELKGEKEDTQVLKF